MAMHLPTATDPRDAGRDLRRSSVRLITVFFMIYILVSGGSFGIEDMVSSSGPGPHHPAALSCCRSSGACRWRSSPASSARRCPARAASTSGRAAASATSGASRRPGGGRCRSSSTRRCTSCSASATCRTGCTSTTCGSTSSAGRSSPSFTLMNMLGVKLIALSSTLFSVLIIAPFVALIVVGLAKWQFNPLTPFTPRACRSSARNGALGLGLAIGVWMYSGYESMSTLSGEIRNPQRDHPARPHAGRALHHRPVRAAHGRRPRRLRPLGELGHRGRRRLRLVRRDRPQARRLCPGRRRCSPRPCSATWPSTSTTWPPARGRCSPSRPTACSPSRSRAVSKRFGTPIAAIVLMAALNAVLIIGPFRNLVVIDVILFISSYVLIFLAAVRLRVREPGLKRPFRVPFGTAGMVAMIMPPILIVIFTIYVNAIDRSTTIFGITGFKLLGLDVGWYGIAGFIALVSGPVCTSSSAACSAGRPRRRARPATTSCCWPRPTRPPRTRPAADRAHDRGRLSADHASGPVRRRDGSRSTSARWPCSHAVGHALRHGRGAPHPGRGRRPGRRERRSVVRFPAELVERSLAAATTALRARRPPPRLELRRSTRATSRCSPTAAPPASSTAPTRRAPPADPRRLARGDATPRRARRRRPVLVSHRVSTRLRAAGRLRALLHRGLQPRSASTCRTRSARPSWRPGSRRSSTSCSAAASACASCARSRSSSRPTSPLTIERDYTESWLALRDYGLPVADHADAAAGRDRARQPAGHHPHRQLRDHRHALPGRRRRRPGTPVIYAPVVATMDPRTGLYAAGAVEHAVICAAGTEMARYYGLPAESSGFCTQTYEPDLQTAWEKANGGLLVDAVRPRHPRRARPARRRDDPLPRADRPRRRR